jgi:protein TonB
VHSVVEEPVVKASEPQVAAETSTKAAVESVEQNAPAISSVSSAANALPSANVGRTGNPNSRIVSTREANYRKQARHYYPPAAMRQKQQGTVVLELIINPRGKVEEIHVKESSGYPLLDNAARDMARRSEYVPARIGNELVTTRTEAAYRFVLPN